ncbi:hypothetical protein BKA70DRAFT_598200 [Coprinopsis sp. MPI-PUGE-AT-0042]|nr:hypothetical protein BKA70DRAFT_598200 [Coprinopsis sp. MPI-PUGE-AT-0042]
MARRYERHGFGQSLLAFALALGGDSVEIYTLGTVYVEIRIRCRQTLRGSSNRSGGKCWRPLGVHPNGRAVYCVSEHANLPERRRDLATVGPALDHASSYANSTYDLDPKLIAYRDTLAL